MKTSWLRWLIALPLLVYCGLLSLLFFSQERLIFPGTPLPQNYTFSFDLPFNEVVLPVEGGSLHGLHFVQPQPRGLIFFLHGNGGNVKEWTEGAEFYQRVNYDMFMLDYRGYGKSTGTIESQQQLHDDVMAAWKHVALEYQKKGLPVVIYGRSLGTALAVELARQVPHQKLVLVSAFTSMQAMAKQVYPYVPGFLLRYPMNTDEIIGEVKTPVTFFHGDKDVFISLTHSKQLSQLTPNVEQVFIVKGAGHNDLHKFDSYLEAFAELLP